MRATWGGPCRDRRRLIGIAPSPTPRRVDRPGRRPPAAGGATENLRKKAQNLIVGRCSGHVKIDAEIGWRVYRIRKLSRIIPRPVPAPGSQGLPELAAIRPTAGHHRDLND